MSQHEEDICQISEVQPYLFLSGCKGLNSGSLRQLGIKRVINASLEVPLIESEEIESIRIPVNDVPGKNHIIIHFDPVAEIIDSSVKNQEGVLVHCVAGVSRSATLILAYLMKHRGMRLRDAFLFLHSKRHVIRPNFSFFEQLISYEKTLFGESTVKMVNISLLDGSLLTVPDLYQEKQFKRKILLEVIVKKRLKRVQPTSNASMNQTTPQFT